MFALPKGRMSLIIKMPVSPLVGCTHHRSPQRPFVAARSRQIISCRAGLGENVSRRATALLLSTLPLLITSAGKSKLDKIRWTLLFSSLLLLRHAYCPATSPALSQAVHKHWQHKNSG